MSKRKHSTILEWFMFLPTLRFERIRNWSPIRNWHRKKRQMTKDKTKRRTQIELLRTREHVKRLMASLPLRNWYRFIGNLVDKNGCLFANLRSPCRSSGMIPLRSIYDESSPLINGAPIETIGQRLAQLNGRKGSHEPNYTSYTHYWKSTLGKPWLHTLYTELTDIPQIIYSWSTLIAQPVPEQSYDLIE